MKSESTKKPYETPKLSVYGDIREITQTVGNMSTTDGGSGSTAKTSL
jgi:hypothetical protein